MVRSDFGSRERRLLTVFGVQEVLRLHHAPTPA